MTVSISSIVVGLVILSLTLAARANFVLQTEHNDATCQNASLVSWSFYPSTCNPTPGGTYARYDCDEGVPIVRIFSQSDCRPGSSVVNTTLSTCFVTDTRGSNNRSTRFACAPLDLSVGVTASYSVRYQYFSQQVCQSNLQNTGPVGWYKITGLRNDYCAAATSSQVFGSSKQACTSTSIQSTFCTDSSCGTCGPATLQLSLTTCATEVVSGVTSYSFGVCSSPTGGPIVPYNYSVVANPPPVPATPTPSHVKYVAQIDFGSGDCSVASARSFRSYDVSICHPGDNAIPAARNYSCVDGVPRVTFVTNCGPTGAALSITDYSTNCVANQRWLCVTDEVPYPALGGVYDRKWRATTQDSCVANSPSTVVTEGSFATCIPSRSVNGLFTELRCSELTRFERVCVDPECIMCMPTTTSNNATECVSNNLNGIQWSGRRCLAPTWTLAQANPAPTSIPPTQQPGVVTQPTGVMQPSNSPQQTTSPLSSSAPTSEAPSSTSASPKQAPGPSAALATPSSTASAMLSVSVASIVAYFGSLILVL